MTKLKLLQIMSEYRSLGVVKGGELCLPPDDALRLSYELQHLGVAIMGLDGWYYLDQDQEAVVQELAVDMSVEHKILLSDNAALQTAQLVRKLIKGSLPERIALVSFTLDVPLEWKLFLES